MNIIINIMYQHPLKFEPRDRHTPSDIILYVTCTSWFNFKEIIKHNIYTFENAWMITDDFLHFYL